MVRTQIQLTEEQAKALKIMAHSKNLSVAELIRLAVDNMIKSSSMIDIAERQKRAIETVGMFKSGKRDISRNHDAYLADAYEK